MAPTIPKVLTFRRKYLDPSQTPPDWVEDMLPTKSLHDYDKVAGDGGDKTIADITLTAGKTFRLTYLNVATNDDADKWCDLVTDIDAAPTTIDSFMVNHTTKPLQGSLKEPIHVIEAEAGKVTKLQLIVKATATKNYAGTLEGFIQFQEEATV